MNYDFSGTAIHSTGTYSTCMEHAILPDEETERNKPITRKLNNDLYVQGAVDLTFHIRPINISEAWKPVHIQPEINW